MPTKGPGTPALHGRALMKASRRERRRHRRLRRAGRDPHSAEEITRYFRLLDERERANRRPARLPR